MTGSEKRKVLLFLAMVIVVTIVLAASLSNLELKPGMPPPEIKNAQVTVAYESTKYTEVMTVNRFITILAALVCAVLLVYTLYRVLAGASWSDIFTFLRFILTLIILMGVVLFVVMMMPHTTGTVQTEVFIPTMEPPKTAPLGPVPPILLWIVGGLLAGFGLLMAVWLIRSAIKKPSTSDLIALEAEKARRDLLLGIGLKDVIIKCYRQMSLILQEDRGIVRHDAMTTLEFENTLSAAGFPAGAVHELTGLFNAARYGNWQPSPEDEQKAIRCFETITCFTRLPGENG